MNVIAIKIDESGIILMEKIKDFKDELSDIYSLLDCQSFESVQAYHLQESLGLEDVILLLDEEGALKDSPIVNIPATISYCNDLQYPIFGNVIICKLNIYEGKLIGLSDVEMDVIIEYFNETIF